MQALVLLSGPIAVGKSLVAKELIGTHKFRKISSGGYLSALASGESMLSHRSGLQELGDRLDVETDYRWVLDKVAVPTILSNRAHALWLFDSVRKQRQVEHFRVEYGSTVFHVHLTAPEHVIRSRYEIRLAKGDEYEGNTPYDQAVLHPNEVASRQLVGIADFILDVADISPEIAAREIVETWHARNTDAPGRSD